MTPLDCPCQRQLPDVERSCASASSATPSGRSHGTASPTSVSFVSGFVCFNLCFVTVKIPSSYCAVNSTRSGRSGVDIRAGKSFFLSVF